MNTRVLRALLIAAGLSLPAAACGDTTPSNDRAAATVTDKAGHDDPSAQGDEDHTTAESTRFDAEIADAAQTITIVVVNGAPQGGSERIEVPSGSVIALMVTSDTDDTVHVHGYDIVRAVSVSDPAHFAFSTDIPGVFDVELEGSGQLLAQLQIS